MTEGCVTLTFTGGPCDGLTADIDPKDAGLRIEVALWRDAAVVLGQPTHTDLGQLQGARWELYERDREDPSAYRHVEDFQDRAFMYDPSDAGDRWAWTGWGDWSDPPIDTT